VKAVIATAVAILALTGTAAAAATRLSSFALNDPASRGLAVTGPLSDFVATSSARVMAPTTWHRLTAPQGHLRFDVRQNGSCSFTVSYAVTSVLAPSGNAADAVASQLPAATPKHLIDAGVRGDRAFRVIRRPGVGGRVRVDALWIGVLTKRADIAPAGQSAWTRISVSAISTAGSECHSGTWRDSLGPTIGDSLAVARTRLHFTMRR
jgi:hypothetical protein